MYQYPPSNFNLIPNAFRPSESYEIVKGLDEIVQGLISRGRYKSALDEVFKVLDSSPDNEHALRLAMFVFGSRTSILQAAEPIPDQYHNDTRLDSIFTVCSNCMKTMWVSQNCLIPTPLFLKVTNPVGLQCYGCGYVVCRNCLKEQFQDYEFALVERICPNCKEVELSTPVFPTGRPSLQVKRNISPVIHAIVFREGPMPLTKETIYSLFGTISPDIVDDKPVLHGIPVPEWPKDIMTMIGSKLLEYSTDGELKVNLEPDLSNLLILPIESQGIRAVLVKIVAPDKLCKGVLDLMQYHLEHVAANYLLKSSGASVVAEWKRLLENRIARHVLKEIAKMVHIIGSDKTKYPTSIKNLGDIGIMITIAPATDWAMVREKHFSGRYLIHWANLSGDTSGDKPDEIPIAHWIFLLKDGVQDVLLSYAPASWHQPLLYPQELISNYDRAMLKQSPREVIIM